MSESQKNKKVLVLAAHPDDETIGPGATLARLADEGHYMKLLTFTDGVSARGLSSENRNNRLKSVCSHLGITITPLLITLRTEWMLSLF